MNVNVQCKLLYDKLIRKKVNLVNNDLQQLNKFATYNNE